MSDPFGSFGDADPFGYSRKLAAQNQTPDFTGSSVMTSAPAPMQFGPSTDDTSNAPPPPVTGAPPAPMGAGKPAGNGIPAEIPQPTDTDISGAKDAEAKARQTLLDMQGPMQANLKAAQDANTDYAHTLHDRAATIDATVGNAPKDRMAFVMKQSPLFLGLAALAGGVFHTGATTGLSAMNGAVKGILEGNEQAYQDAITQYRQSLQQMQMHFDLQDKEYEAAQKNFGLSAEGNQLALQFANIKLGWDKDELNKFEGQREAVGKMLWQASQQDKQFEQQKQVAGIRANAGMLDAADMAILAEKAKEGVYDPYRANKRTAGIQAGMFAAEPDLDMNAAHGKSALQANAPFMTRQYAAEMLPQIIANVTAAGKAVDFSHLTFAGKLEQWKKGQLNDPAFINYMSQRNDALMAIAAVMRNIGMSDKAIDKEYEASPATMDPAAYDAWANGQWTALLPRLQLAGKYTGNTSDTRGLPPPSSTATLSGSSGYPASGGGGSSSGIVNVDSMGNPVQ